MFLFIIDLHVWYGARYADVTADVWTPIWFASPLPPLGSWSLNSAHSASTWHHMCKYVKHTIKPDTGGSNLSAWEPGAGGTLWVWGSLMYRVSSRAAKATKRWLLGHVPPCSLCACLEVCHSNPQFHYGSQHHVRTSVELHSSATAQFSWRSWILVHVNICT